MRLWKYIRRKQMKTTEHAIGNVYPKIFDWKCKMASSGKPVEVFGIVFSNEGSKGRDPLFDISESQITGIFQLSI